MLTLKNCVEAAKCRKGPAKGTTKRGAYWLAHKPIKIRRAGGDGIGNSGADLTFTLELRHFRGGEVRSTIHCAAYHQNGDHDSYESLDLGDCSSVEQVIVRLKGHSFCDGDACYSDFFEDTLTAALVELGLPEREPAPDEAATN